MFINPHSVAATTTLLQENVDVRWKDWPRFLSRIKIRHRPKIWKPLHRRFIENLERSEVSILMICHFRNLNVGPKHGAFVDLLITGLGGRKEHAVAHDLGRHTLSRIMSWHGCRVLPARLHSLTCYRDKTAPSKRRHAANACGVAIDSSRQKVQRIRRPIAKGWFEDMPRIELGAFSGFCKRNVITATPHVHISHGKSRHSYEDPTLPRRNIFPVA